MELCLIEVIQYSFNTLQYFHKLSTMALVMVDQIEEAEEEFSYYNKHNNCPHKRKYKIMHILMYHFTESFCFRL